MDLDYTEKSGRDAFKNIMRCVDPQGNQRAVRAAVLEYFALPNFLKIANLKAKNRKDILHGGTNHSNDSVRSDDSSNLRSRTASYFD
jgi:hypothetical protein